MFLHFTLPGCLPSGKRSTLFHPALTPGFVIQAPCFNLMSISTHAHRPHACWFLHLRRNANTCNWSIDVIKRYNNSILRELTLKGELQKHFDNNFDKSCMLKIVFFVDSIGIFYMLKHSLFFKSTNTFSKIYALILPIYATRNDLQCIS